MLFLILTGCSSDEEVLRVGTPFQEGETNGVEFHTDITDSELVTDLRDVINLEKEVEKPADLEMKADVFFTLDLPQEGISEIRRYVWYLEDGSTLLTHEDPMDSTEDDRGFYMLAAEQTQELKGILEH
ncbi:hypothetical protein BB776_00765 [Planococcus salinarum]|uniref:Uncharacterized protein n=1 Tax=Planococcus salinarum TaxID=622695 RepID=A0ABX3D175_9BACL|nr:hypothetical protein [Planococcus salinarum]OHX51149.1 hypothetical protein BB776_00765 [Planococcus salinarum]TAA69238.1 hypothetical protein D2909_13080 [Planococcus salinarum]